MKIFFLEDNSTDADLTIRGLMEAFPDCAIEYASTIKQARSILQTNHLFDIAILDKDLPDGNGLELLLEIRKQKLNFPVIMITGSGDEETAVTALKTGADDYIVKRSGYILQLQNTINQAIINYSENALYKSDVINLLYIEHHAADIDFTKRHFAQYAPYINVETVATAEEALAILEKEKTALPKYQVILMDYRLPGMNALDLIKTIRQKLKITVPIIMATGQGSEDLAVQALKIGANHYLTKNKKYLFKLPNLIVNSFQHWELKEKQKALIESEAKYRLIADNSGDTIFVLDMDLKYTYISPAIKFIRGFEPEEAMDHKISDVLTPDSYQRALKTLSQLILENSKNPDNIVLQKSIELELVHKNKSTVWTEVKASLILDDNKNPVGILGVTRDISERKATADELKKLSRAVEQSPTIIVITDTNGNIEYVNPKFTETTGYSLEEVIGKNPRFLKSGYTSHSEYENLWKTIITGAEWRGEFYNKRKDGTFYWEETAISSIRNVAGEITHFLAVKSDITEKKKIVDELVIAKEKAEKSDQLKSAFLANISHEIRTPMNGILGFAELLKESDLTRKQKKKYIKIIVKSGNRMLNIINDIVDISKIEAGLVELRISETNINEQIEYAYTFFKPEADKKEIQLSLNIKLSKQESLIKTDREKFYSIIFNLIKNAIKYTDSGTIEIGYNPKNINNTPYLEFYITDTGIGIPGDKQLSIFERFIQADITDKQARQGAGLGLSISKAYIELLGGTIRVESEVGKGSTFYFTLPYATANQIKKIETKQVPASEYGINKKLNILIAEDDAFSEKLLSIILKPIANTILIAKNGAEAVESCKENPDIDLVLMDIQMPVMNGFEATRQIRLFNEKVIIIAQTAFALSGDEEKAKSAGCNSYINKPIKEENLFLAIKENKL